MNLVFRTWPNDHRETGPPVDLAHHDVHLWQATLPPDSLDDDPLAKNLNADEVCWSARYRFPRDRRQFIFARGVLRALLGKYLGLPAGQVPLAYQPGGKPLVPPSATAGGLHFNLSHTTDLVLFAFSRCHPVGVDVEHIERPVDWRGLAERILSLQEKAELNALPPSCQQRAFYEVWTCKEALLKATGEGLSDAMNELEVSVSPFDLPRLISFRTQTTTPVSCALYKLALGKKHAGALALLGGSIT